MPLSLSSVQHYMPSLPQRSWFLQSDAITKNTGHKYSSMGSRGHFPCALVTAGSRAGASCLRNSFTALGAWHPLSAMANGSHRSDQRFSRSGRIPLSAYTSLLMLMHWTSFMEAEMIQHMPPAVW